MSYFIQSTMDQFVQRKITQQQDGSTNRPHYSAEEYGGGKSFDTGHYRQSFANQMRSNENAANRSGPLKRSLTNAGFPAVGNQNDTKTSALTQPPKRAALSAMRIPTTLSNTTTSATAPATMKTPSGDRPMQLLTGSVERILHWRHEYPLQRGLCETFTRVLRISDDPQEAPPHQHRIMLLRDENAKPVLQAHHYAIDFPLPADVVAGAPVRCVGRFSSNGRFQVYKCRRLSTGVAGDDQIGRMIARLTSLTNFALSSVATEAGGGGGSSVSKRPLKGPKPQQRIGDGNASRFWNRI